jgi:PAS domain S-box-containing protein
MTDRSGVEVGGGSASGWSRALGACSIALGVLVLIGWATGIDALTRVFPGMITMKPNAAIGFLLAGLALRAIPREERARRWAVGLSMAVATLGALTLIEYVADLDFGIDQLLFTEPAGSLGSIKAGRMHPTTALNFILIGLASALLAADREPSAAQGMALLAAFVAGVTLIGYLFGLREFIGLAMFSQMAIHTTVGMLALSLGLLLARPHRGLMAPLCDDGPSGQMARWLLPVAILMPLIATALTVVGYEAGFLEFRYAMAMRVTIMISVFLACIWANAASLHRIDSARVEGEKRTRFLAESMPQIVWISGPDGRIEYLNRRWYDYTGQDPNAQIQWRTVIHPDDVDRCIELWNHSVRSGRAFQGEYRYRRADGVYRWHLARAEPMCDPSGRVVQWVGTTTDVDEQKRAGELKYRSLVEATSAIVWNADASGEFAVSQPGWSAYTGKTLEDCMGSRWSEAIHPDDREATVQAWSGAVASGSTYQILHRLRRHDGVYRHMMARAVPLLDDEGQILEWIGVHTDVDEREQAHEAMRQSKEAAEAASRAKAEFLANMSHEIRTPMNGVLGMTELALATELTPRQREYLGLVKSSADALLTVVDDILDFSKIEAGKLTLDPVPFDVRDLVTDTLRCLALKAHEKRLELACRIAPEVPNLVVGDPGRLRQVIINLVGNAIKFTERGEVFVAVEPDPEVNESGALRFSVADTGIGIPEAKRESIFRPFEQADGSTTRKYGGTGLGLTISTQLIALMGGRIWIEENPGGGSVFRFTARLDGEVSARSGPPEAPPIVLADLRILIVDDNRTNRMILEEILTQWGCRPVAVEGADEAIKAMDRAAVRGEPFPLVLLDRMMPGIDGCELATRLKADPRHASARLMMLTSGGADEACRAAEIGIATWLSKPIRQSDLLESILDLIGGDLPPPAPSLDQPDPATSLAGGRRLRVLLAEDHPINQKVAIRMLEDQGHEVVVVGNGRLAVEAVASGSFDAVLMDVAMPEMGGFEALEIIRAREAVEGGRVPIIALTAHAMTEDRQRCLDAGFDDYLSKPVRASGLAASLGRIVAPSDSASTDEARPAANRAVFDPDEALDGLAGDEPLFREILGVFLDEGPRLAAEVRQAAEQGDAPSLKRQAHTLAGTAGHFAAHEVVAAARRVEAIGQSGELAEALNAASDLDRAFDRFLEAVAASPFATGPAVTAASRARLDLPVS